MLMSGTTELAAVYLPSLEILGGVLVRNNLMPFSMSSLFFHFCFTVIWTGGESAASQTKVDIRIYEAEANS